jgi:hypothetical protein
LINDPISGVAAIAIAENVAIIFHSFNGSENIEIDIRPLLLTARVCPLIECWPERIHFIFGSPPSVETKGGVAASAAFVPPSRPSHLLFILYFTLH